MTVTEPDRATAPAAPGRLGQSIPAADLLPYLRDLDRWRATRKAELDRIDQAALRATDAASYTSDVALAMAIWQSASDRWEQLTKLWDDGRADAVRREEMSRLIHGSASVTPATGQAGMALSLVEACRLSDALTASLRARLSFDPVAADVVARVAAVRAGLQRSDALNGRGTQVDLAALRRRLDALATTASQGGDVTGPLTFLEADIARAERDLIVASAGHRELSRDFRAAIARRHELTAAQDRVRAVADRCAAVVTPVPRLAVPNVAALGKVPQTRPALDAYRDKLDRVAAALAQAEQAYAAPVAEREELAGRLGALTAKAAATGADAGATGPALRAVAERAAAVLAGTPTPLPPLRDLLAAYGSLLSAAATELTDERIDKGSAR
jgi:hypothetical protein